MGLNVIRARVLAALRGSSEPGSRVQCLLMAGPNCFLFLHVPEYSATNEDAMHNPHVVLHTVFLTPSGLTFYGVVCNSVKLRTP